LMSAMSKQTDAEWVMRWGSLAIAGAGVALTVSGQARGAEAANVNPAYVEFERAVLDGKDVRMVLDLPSCVVRGTDKPGPSIRASLRFDSYLIQKDDSVSFSLTHFTIRNSNLPVDEFISFKAMPSGRVEAHTSFLNAANYTV
jgi:hypothetical protein